MTPTMHWRDGSRVYWHGSAASRFLEKVDGQPVCLTATIMDGYVLARSMFEHSINYRSAMVFGIGRRIKDHGGMHEDLFFKRDNFPRRHEPSVPQPYQKYLDSRVFLDIVTGRG